MDIQLRTIGPQFVESRILDRDDELDAAMGESMAPPFDLVLGRKTYEIFAAYWPHSDDPGAEELNSATKHVASTTLTKLEWENSKLIEGNVAEGVRSLKAQDGPELQVHGSANLIRPCSSTA